MVKINCSHHLGLQDDFFKINIYDRFNSMSQIVRYFSYFSQLYLWQRNSSLFFFFFNIFPIRSQNKNPVFHFLFILLLELNSS